MFWVTIKFILALLFKFNIYETKITTNKSRFDACVFIQAVREKSVLEYLFK